MAEYICTNPKCVFTYHAIPMCPYWSAPPPLPLRPITQTDIAKYQHLRKLKEDGVIHAVPGQGSTFAWIFPFLLVIALPVAVFLFFVLVILFG